VTVRGCLNLAVSARALILILLLAFMPIMGRALLPGSMVLQNVGRIGLPLSIIDSYAEDNADGGAVFQTFHPSNVTNYDSAESQSFIGAASNITGAAFYLRRIGVPIGQLHAVLYSHSGEFGVNSTPSIELARSDSVEASTLPSQWTLMVFTFSGAQQVAIKANTPYCIVLEGPANGFLNDANNIQIAGDFSSPSHVGSWARYRYNTWWPMTDGDIIFYVYGSNIATAFIHGRVLHSDGITPLSGANVGLVGYSTHATTGSDGSYNLNLIPARLYTLRCATIGYQTVEQSVNTTAGGDFLIGDILLTATPRVRVYGYVTYYNNSPASSIAVNLTGDVTYIGTTAANGLYNFPSVIAGDYQLKITASGYRQLGSLSMKVEADTMRNVTLAPRGSLGGKIPIPSDGKVYQAAFCSWGDNAAPLPGAARQDIDRFVSIVGKSLYASENCGTINVNEDFWPMRDPNSWKPLLDEGIFEVFIFGLDPYLRAYPSDSDTVNGPTATEWRIANGTYDAWINTLAQECKDFNYTIMLKIGPEMNLHEGNSGNADFAANPAAYLAAWRRIVDVFAAAGVTNVEWCTSYNWESQGPYDFENYYAGDSYVDWIGVDFYQVGILNDPNVQVAAFYNWALPKNKPLMVTEWGTNWYYQNYSDADRAKYINAFFDAIEARPGIKMIRYQWNQWWRFQDDNPSDYAYMPLTSAAYRDRIANDRYLAYAPPT